MTSCQPPSYSPPRPFMQWLPTPGAAATESEQPEGYQSVSEVAPGSNPRSATCPCSVAKSCLTRCDPVDCNAKDRFHGRQFFHRPGVGGVWFRGWFQHITFIVHFISNLMPPLTWPEAPALSPEGRDPDPHHGVVERTKLVRTGTVMSTKQGNRKWTCPCYWNPTRCDFCRWSLDRCWRKCDLGQPPLPQQLEAAAQFHPSSTTTSVPASQVHTNCGSEQTGQAKPGHPMGNYL